MGKQFLSVREAAETLAVSTRTVARMIAEGSLPSVLVGKKSRRIPVEAITRLRAAALTGGRK